MSLADLGASSIHLYGPEIHRAVRAQDETIGIDGEPKRERFGRTSPGRNGTIETFIRTQVQAYTGRSFSKIMLLCNISKK